MSECGSKLRGSENKNHIRYSLSFWGYLLQGISGESQRWQLFKQSLTIQLDANNVFSSFLFASHVLTRFISLSALEGRCNV